MITFTPIDKKPNVACAQLRPAVEIEQSDYLVLYGADFYNGVVHVADHVGWRHSVYYDFDHRKVIKPSSTAGRP